MPPERPHLRRPQTARSRFIPIQLLFPLLLLLSLSSSLLSNVPLASAHAAVTPLPTQKATQTFGQFLAHKAPARKPFVYPSQMPNRFAKEQAQNPAKILPSTEPVKMQALHQTLSPAFLVNTGATPAATTPPATTATVTATKGTPAANGTVATKGTPAATGTSTTKGTPAASGTVTATETPPATGSPAVTATPTAIATPAATATPATPLHLQGSDGRLTVTIPPGALDSSQATLSSSHATVASTLMQSGVVLTITQVTGHSVDNVDSLGKYQFQFADPQGNALSGLRLRQPVTIQYHYQPGEIEQMGLEPGSLLLTWPVEIRAALDAKQPTTGLVVHMHNNAATHTLSAQVTTLGTIASVATGTATNQTPPKPLEASVQPNTGQLAYTYPITVAPGPNGTTPTVQLTYSSAATNARHEPTSPADSPGEGWGLSLGSISSSTYPSGSAATGTWYFLNGVDNVSDRLIPVTSGSSSYYTEHVSRLKIQRATSQATGQPCFNVWDTAGNYSEYGCTPDSLQDSIDSNGVRTNYRWDLDLVVPTNEGNSTSNRSMSLAYQQEKIPVGSYMTVRDAVLRQISYGTSSSGSGLAGTVDFLYKGVANYSSNGIQWVSAYGTNEGGCTPPAGNTTLRCDDPVNYSGGLTAPTVMSTYSLQTIKSYVGDDSSSSHLDYSYSLSTSDTAYHQCTDGHTGATAWCAGQHLLNSITPTVYQNGTGSALPAVTFQYQGLHNTYIDTSQTMSYGKYGSNNYWQYLHAFSDHSTGMTEFITYLTGDNNTHGTPNTGTDNRFDPTYCTIRGGCSGSFANQDDHAWSEQLVNTITIAPTDTNSPSLPSAETTYSYGMATQSGATCTADSAGLTACPVDTWYPSGENDWQDYYHGEFRGFSWVYIVSPAGI